jgi:Rrf2 family nitric oxide-sensitive transcriptional repressor
MALGFSQRFGYAAHALAYMAKKPAGALTTLPELAEWMRSVWSSASEAYLSNVIQRLARGGVLQSHRGIAGGYSLARAADRITLRDVAEVLEGVSLERCALSLGPSCPKQGGCAIQRTLRRVEEKYLQSLEEISLAEVAAEMSIKLPKGVSV